MLNLAKKVFRVFSDSGDGDAIPIADHWTRMAMGNAKSFDAIYYCFNAKLIKFGTYYVHQREIAEEIVSDVFVNCWMQRQTLQDIRNPETYLFVCVKNKCLNYVKKMSTIHLVSIEDNTLQLVDIYQPEAEVEFQELMFKLNQGIETLPLQCRMIFRMVKEDGMKCKEVADILEISVRTVHTQLFRAMKKLHALMSEKQPNKEALKRQPG